MQYTNYVVGFAFNFDYSEVLLIEKLKPEWQKGKRNGIGGKIEFGESQVQAMVREFREETGVETIEDNWIKRLTLGGLNGNLRWEVSFFITQFTHLNHCRSMETEQVVIVPTKEIHMGNKKLIRNLPWVIPFCLDPDTDKAVISEKGLYQ